MRNDDPKTVVRKKLKLLFDAVAEHAAENPEFMARLEKILVLPTSDTYETANERTSPTRKPTGPNLLEVLHSGGETALHEVVSAMTTDELVRLCVQEGLRRQKEAKALERPALIALLHEMARSRLGQGGSFVRGGA